MAKKLRPLLIVISVVMLLLAIAPVSAELYYILLRFVVCATTIYLAFQAKRLNKNSWMWVMLAIAILFNPVLSLRLDKVNFVLLNLITVCLLIASLVKIKDEKDPPHLNTRAINLILGLLFIIIIISIALYSYFLKQNSLQ